MKKLYNYIMSLFKSPMDILNELYPYNTLNSTDAECIKSDFNKIIKF